MSGRNHLGMNRIVLAILIGLALGHGAGARAATVLIAGAAAGTEGAYNSGFPFNTSLFRGGSMRFQQVYEAEEFAQLTKELVLMRGQKSLEFNERDLALDLKEAAQLREYELPRKAKELARKLVKAERALSDARSAKAKGVLRA